MSGKRSAPYKHPDGTDCYTRNCHMRHLSEAEFSVFKVLSTVLSDQELTENVREALVEKLENNNPATTDPVVPKPLSKRNTIPEPVTKKSPIPTPFSKKKRKEKTPFKNPSITKEGDSVSLAEFEPTYIAPKYPVKVPKALQDKARPYNDPEVQQGKRFPVVYGDGSLKGIENSVFIACKPDQQFKNSPQRIRIQFSHDLSKEEKERLVKLVAYRYRSVFNIPAGKTAIIDSPRSFVLKVNALEPNYDPKKQIDRDNVGEFWEEFNSSIASFVKEGSPVRKSTGERKYEGFGDGLEIQPYYSQY